jgi:hypothetical protein
MVVAYVPYKNNICFVFDPTSHRKRQYILEIGMLVNPRGRVTHAVIAGLCAAASSLFGKLSGIQDYSTCVSIIVFFSTAVTSC